MHGTLKSKYRINSTVFLSLFLVLGCTETSSDRGGIQMMSGGRSGGSINGGAVGGEIVNEGIQGGETGRGGMLGGEVVSGGVPGGESVSGGMLSGDIINGGVPGGETVSGGVPGGESVSGGMPGGEIVNGGMLGGEAVSGATPGGATAGGATLGGEPMIGGATMGGESMIGGATMGGEMIGGTFGGEMMDLNQVDEEIISNLISYLSTPINLRSDFTLFEAAITPLNQATANRVQELLWNDYRVWVEEELRDDHARGEVTVDGVTMRYACFFHGQQPNQGWSLYLSMHGGGGAPASVNDQQWMNQQHLYDSTGQIQEGLYCAPRAPTNTWNLWHQAHIDPLFTKLISTLHILENVNTHRVFLMGYSAGGDGTYQLAPRMADRWAAAAMSAGHPNNANPYGLRNIGFTIHMGELDTAYNRSTVAAQWGMRLAELQNADPEPTTAYQHQVTIHPNRGHWMSLADAVLFDFMRPFTRDPWPSRIHWHQSNVTHSRFYWLKDRMPTGGHQLFATQEGQNFVIAPNQNASLSLLLHDQQLDLDQPIHVEDGSGNLLFEGEVSRTSLAIYQSIWSRGDQNQIVHAEVNLDPILIE